MRLSPFTVSALCYFSAQELIKRRRSSMSTLSIRYATGKTLLLENLTCMLPQETPASLVNLVWMSGSAGIRVARSTWNCGSRPDHHPGVSDLYPTATLWLAYPGHILARTFAHVRLPINDCSAAFALGPRLASR